MKKIVSLALVAIIGSSLILACSQPASPATTTSKAPASVVITPPNGVPNTKIRISGAGFNAGEEVTLMLRVLGVDTMIGTEPTGGAASGSPVVANDQGAFTTGTMIPAAMEPGAYTVRAEGNKGSAASVPLVVDKVVPKK